MENEIKQMMDYRILMGTGVNVKGAIETLQLGMNQMFKPGKHRIAHLVALQELVPNKNGIINGQPQMITNVIAVIEVEPDGLNVVNTLKPVE